MTFVVQAAPVTTLSVEDDLLGFSPGEWAGYLYDHGPFVRKVGSLPTVLNELKENPLFNEAHFLGYNYTYVMETIGTSYHTYDEIRAIAGFPTENEPKSLDKRGNEVLWCERELSNGPGNGMSYFAMFFAAIPLALSKDTCTSSRLSSCQNLNGCHNGVSITLCNNKRIIGKRDGPWPDLTPVVMPCSEVGKRVIDLVPYIQDDINGRSNCMYRDRQPNWWKARNSQSDDPTWDISVIGC
ncbi:hypothetical protein TWF694_003739 [Orbilia ellipsospora]|uniref:Uncharacterized protein n=1 Tax=Orbilia ellipsospora TaxID=2528407 RepID=A0AAV9X1L4_9PEZI